MTSKTLFSADDLTALHNIATACTEAGLWVYWEDTHRFTTKPGAGCSVTATIRPAREQDGITVTGCSREGRKILDGQAAGFAADGQNIRKLRLWLAEMLS